MKAIALRDVRVDGRKLLDEGLHREKSPALDPKWKAIKVVKVGAEHDLKEVDSALGKPDSLDELVVETAKGLHVVYGRGFRGDVKAGQSFRADGFEGTVVAVHREVAAERVLEKVITGLGHASLPVLFIGAPVIEAALNAAQVDPNTSRMAGMAWLYLAATPGMFLDAVASVDMDMAFAAGTGIWEPKMERLESVAA